MKKLVCSLFFSSAISIGSYGQEWLGYMTDNYAGIHSLKVQPASIVNTPYKYDISIMSAGVGGYNMNLFKSVGGVVGDDELSFQDNEQEFLVRGALLLPSLLWKIDDRSAFAIRNTFNANVFTEASSKDIMRLLSSDFDVPELIGTTFEDEFFTARTHAWWEFSGTYGRLLYDDSKHRVNGALTVSLMTGSVGGYINFDDLTFTLLSKDSLLNVGGRAGMVYNSSLDNFTTDEKVDLFSTSGVSGGLGLEYFYFEEPDHYKFKFGFSVYDLGSLKYDKSVNSGDFQLTNELIQIETFRNVESLDALADSLDMVLVSEVDTGDELGISLPTKIGIQADYHIKGKYYVNLSNYIALRGNRRRVDETQNTTAVLLTPRMELEKWGLSVPLVYSSVVGFASGFSFRYGPVHLGATNLFSAIFNEISAVNVYLGFKITRLNGRRSGRSK